MPGANDHVEEYLSYYSRLSNGPGFAVLVSGPWGCGKTHLIKRLLEQWANKPGFPKYIYVSLYGISDTKQIDDAFFQQLHPVLGSKGMRIAGAVLKGILRTTIKIDLHEIGKSDAAVSSQIPDLSLPEYLTNVGDRLLIFDDLERCKLPLSDALGYINSFVEHDDCKAIIVANEEEITDQEAYRVAKEKLIGKTFEVVPDLGSAFTYFADAMSDPAATCYRKHVDVVTAVFRESETNNLRILKQTMIEFERVFNVLSDAHREHEAAAVDLLRLVFSLNFELRKGRLSVEAVAELDPLRALISGGDSAITLLRKRYPETDFRQTLLDYPLIARTLGKGIVEGEVIRSALDRHHYFAPPGAEPAWRILWHSSLRSDAEVATALEKVEEQFTARQFVLDGEIIHVAGLRLWLAKIGAIPKTVEEVVSETKSYIDELYRAGKLKETGDDRRYWWSLSHGWEGLSFYEQGTPELQDILKHLREAKDKLFEDSLPDKAAKLMDQMAVDPSAFLKQVSITSDGDNTFCSIPVLATIEPVEFVDKLLALLRERQHTVFLALHNRYDAPLVELQPERVWLTRVTEMLKDRANSMSPIAAAVLRRHIDNDLAPFIQRDKSESSEARPAS